jgi:hypothetical protein
LVHDVEMPYARHLSSMWEKQAVQEDINPASWMLIMKLLQHIKIYFLVCSDSIVEIYSYNSFFLNRVSANYFFICCVPSRTQLWWQ